MCVTYKYSNAHIRIFTSSMHFNIVVSSEASSLTDDLLDEILQMRTFNHRNILSLKGLAILNNIPHMLLPFMSNGDLKKYISDKTKVTLLCCGKTMVMGQ